MHKYQILIDFSQYKNCNQQVNGKLTNKKTDRKENLQYRTKNYLLIEATFKVKN